MAESHASDLVMRVRFPLPAPDNFQEVLVMIIFRPHRKLLDEAMAEAKEFNTVEEMKEHIVKLWHEGWGGSKELFTVDDIVINEE